MDRFRGLTEHNCLKTHAWTHLLVDKMRILTAMGFESKYQHFGAKSMKFIDLLRFSYVKPKKEIREILFFQIRSYFILYHSGMSPAPSRVPARLVRAFPRAWHLLPRLRCSAALSLPLPAADVMGKINILEQNQ